jgi:hypothetical protein
LYKVSLSTNKPRNAPIESKDAGKFARKRAESAELPSCNFNLLCALAVAESQNQRAPSKAILEMKANKREGPHSRYREPATAIYLWESAHVHVAAAFIKGIELVNNLGFNQRLRYTKVCNSLVLRAPHAA